MSINNVVFLDKLTLRHPTPKDALMINGLVKASPPLDQNSVYCNLLQCSHFAATSVVAAVNHKLVGAITGYRPPEDNRTLFIWQVVVSESFRGSGLAKRMLHWLVNQAELSELSGLSTTITQSNGPSWALFESFARDRGTRLRKSLLFNKHEHFGGKHDDEHLLNISLNKGQAEKTMESHLDDLKGGLLRYLPHANIKSEKFREE